MNFTMRTFTPIGQYRATFSDEESKRVAFSWWMKLFVLLVLEARLVAVDQFRVLFGSRLFPGTTIFLSSLNVAVECGAEIPKKLENKNTSLRRTPAVSFG